MHRSENFVDSGDKSFRVMSSGDALLDMQNGPVVVAQLTARYRRVGDEICSRGDVAGKRSIDPPEEVCQQANLCFTQRPNKDLAQNNRCKWNLRKYDFRHPAACQG